MKNTVRIATALATLSGLLALGVVGDRGVEAGPEGGTDLRPVPSAAAPPAAPPAAPAPVPPPAPVRLNPDPRNPAGDLIEVSIARQQVTAWRDGIVHHRFTISTGRPGYETPTGHYRILQKEENRWSRKWKVWMPYAMRWYQGYFFHELPYRSDPDHRIGATKLGRPDSHGCVRVGVGDAELLFRWTKVGTPVWVH